MGNKNPECRNVIMLHADYEALKADIDRLRTELSMLVLERDELLYHECRNIEMEYMLAVGGLVYKAYEIECAILRLKRKTELIQAKMNRQEKIIISEIEDVLDSELADYQEKLNDLINKMNTALERGRMRGMTDEEVHELKTLYRAVVKALHPDLHPDLSDTHMRLFHNAVSAYENGDLDGLRAIAAMVTEPSIRCAEPDGYKALTREKERLTKLVQSVRDGIDEIKSRYPYTMKALIQRPDRIKARRNELRERISQLNEVLARYETRIAEMLE